MHVDPDTLLLHDLDEQQVAVLSELTDKIVFEGTFPSTDWVAANELIDAWIAAGKFDGRQKLLVMSTVFPIRAYRSIMINLGHE